MPMYIILGGIFLGLLSPFNALESHAATENLAEQWYEVVGQSMEPFGFLEGRIVEAVERDVSVGDHIIFSCTVPGCDGYYIKNLVGMEEGCYWVEGRQDIWEDVYGQKKFSLDSVSEFGWLCSDDIEILGVAQRVT